MNNQETRTQVDRNYLKYNNTKLRGKSKGKCLTSSRWHIYKSVRCYFSRSGGEAYFNSSKISIGEGSGSPLQYSCLENPMDRGAWWVTVHGVAKSRKRLSDFHFFQ